VAHITGQWILQNRLEFKGYKWLSLQF